VLASTAKPVIVGVIGNDTRSVCRFAEHSIDIGASALLCPTPYYNRCTQEGLIAHFRSLTSCVDVPVILYNVPARTGVTVTPDTLARLLLLPHVVGVKEATVDAIEIIHYANVCHSLHRTLICGDDAMLPVFRAVGAECVISAAANAIPDVIAEGILMPLADMPRWCERYLPLIEAMFAEVNPIRVKQACYHLGLCANQLRLPLTPSADRTLVSLLQKAGFSIVMA
jgi:4-hydroxy-tetrahydrodipicolinate synthase